MRHSHEYPVDDCESGYDAAAWERAVKEQEFNSRKAEAPSQEPHIWRRVGWGRVTAVVVIAMACAGLMLGVL